MEQSRDNNILKWCLLYNTTIILYYLVPTNMAVPIYDVPTPHPPVRKTVWSIERFWGLLAQQFWFLAHQSDSRLVTSSWVDQHTSGVSMHSCMDHIILLACTSSYCNNTLSYQQLSSIDILQRCASPRNHSMYTRPHWRVGSGTIKTSMTQWQFTQLYLKAFQCWTLKSGTW